MSPAPVEADQSADAPPSLAGAAARLGAYPGPVVALSRSGAVLGANGPGQALGQLIAGGRSPELRQALARLAGIALDQDSGLVERLEAASGAGRQWFEVAVVPNGGDQVLVFVRDATLETNMRLALVDSRQRYRDLVEISSDFAWETDAVGSFVFVSPQGALGYPAERLVGMRPRTLLVGHQPGDAVPFEAREPCHQALIWVRDVNGGEACLLVSARPIYDQTGTSCGTRGLCRDVTAERLRDSALARSRVREQVVAYIVKQIREEVRPAAMLDAAATALGRATATAAGVFMAEQADQLVLAASHGDWFDEPHSHDLAVALRSTGAGFDGRIGAAPVLARPTCYRGTVNGAIAIVRLAPAPGEPAGGDPARGDPAGGEPPWGEDVGALLDAVAGQLGIALRQIADQRALERLSRTDALTGLLNRRAFERKLDGALARARRDGQPGVLVYIDLDNFKPINDRYGHQRGDEILCAVSELLSASSRAYDLAARLGGDEFVLWLSGLDVVAGDQRASELLACLVALSDLAPNDDAPLGMSIGIAMYDPAVPEAVEALVLRADGAMYQAKRSGKNRTAVAPAPVAPAPVAPARVTAAASPAKPATVIAP